MKRLPELAKAINALPTKEWDRATRSLSDGINIKQAVHVRGAYAKVLDRPGARPHHATRPNHPCPVLRAVGDPPALRKLGSGRIISAYPWA